MTRLIVILLTVFAAASASAATFSDPFTTDPYAGVGRWCERIHHVHWDSVNKLMSGVNGTSCTGGRSCCTCSTPPNLCSTTNVGGHQAITISSFTGNTRSAQSTFAAQRLFINSGGLFEHVAVFSVSHSNCHAGFQAYVYRDNAHAGKYAMSVQATDDSNGGTNPECGIIGTVNGPSVDNITLATTTLPRYQLLITTAVSGAVVNVNAQLTDTSSGTVLATITNWPASKPTWYNNQAKRFSIGGVLDPNQLPSSTLPQDNFIGQYN